MLKKFISGAMFAAALFAQIAVPPQPSQSAPAGAPIAAISLDTPALETYLRHLLLWPAEVEIKLGQPTQSPMSGLYTLNVQGTLGGRTQQETFYISADGQTLIQGNVFEVKKSPFQSTLDLLKTDNQPALGLPGAPVTVVEFGDFECPYCKQEAGVLRTQLMEAFPNDLRLSFMDFPLEPIHPYARGAAILGRCIYSQNNASFWAYHDWIFAHQAELTPDNLRDNVMEYAKTDKSLDTTRLAACAVAAAPREEVDRSLSVGKALNVNSTPTLFINGRRMVGTIPLDDLKAVVGQEIAYAKILKKDEDCCRVQIGFPGAAAAPPVKAPSK